MKLADLKKGTRVLLGNGWQAILEDNKKNGTTRMATVFGFETEMGSVYSHDIVGYAISGNSFFNRNIEYTPQQLKCKEMAKAMGM